ncbi:MAG: RagB/SusD family nutrient uptake outer membrane protein [Prolixibacteraceae bacterium]|nr:RagB/SusD family nutrient uptake outer membrane protein [Prolixibacteraceae bacterium]
MKTKIALLTLFISLLGLSSCDKYLDLTPTDKLSDKVVWQNASSVELYVNGFYPYIASYGSFGSGESQVGLTEGLTETLKYGSMTPGTHVGFANILAYGSGGISAPTASWNLGMWDDLYTRIRRVNEFISGLKKYGTALDETSKNRFEAEARFFRAFLYFQLIKRSGDVILYDEDLSAISRDKDVSPESEGWDMVQKDLEFAANNLPAEWPVANRGKVTKGAAFAMQSRAMLYAKRWDVAKAAADEVIKLNLYTLPAGTTVADYNKSFKSSLAGNTESILEYNYLIAGPNHGFDKLFTPGGDATGIGGRATPTQEMVESYEKASGGFVDWSAWHTEAGTTVVPPYSQLEVRFHASVLYNGADWKGRKIETFVGGTDGWASFKDDPNPSGRTTTGYYLRKLVDETHTDLNSVPSTQTWVAIRLSEVYLNRAEAAYMLKDLSTANSDVRKVRERVGLPYSDKSGEDLMAAIRQERKIELAYEGHLYWDMRRWHLAHTAYSGPGSRVHGFKIVKEGANMMYSYVDCDKQDRSFPEKMYRIPLPETELMNNSAIQQYSEWK